MKKKHELFMFFHFVVFPVFMIVILLFSSSLFSCTHNDPEISNHTFIDEYDGTEWVFYNNTLINKLSSSVLKGTYKTKDNQITMTVEEIDFGTMPYKIEKDVNGDTILYIGDFYSVLILRMKH